MGCPVLLSQLVWIVLCTTGWAMQSACLIFIKRKWDEDKIILTKMLNYFAAIKHKTQVTITKLSLSQRRCCALARGGTLLNHFQPLRSTSYMFGGFFCQKFQVNRELRGFD